MIRAAIVSISTLTACGRVDFASVADGGSSADSTVDRCADVFGPDEDGDGAPDACDVCPHLDDDQTDSDSDGVGDSCDVEPAMPRQRIRFFDGFNSVRDEWTASGTVTGGQLVIPVDATDSTNVLEIPTSLADIHIGGTIVAVGALPNHMFVAVKPAPNESYYIELIDRGIGRRRALMYWLDPTYSELSGVTDTGMTVQPGPFTLYLSARASRIVGAIETVGAATMQLEATGTPPFTSERMLLYLQNLSVAFDYAIVIETF